MAAYSFGVDVEPHKRWPVAWYNPAVLLQSLRELVSAADVMRNSDPRELWTGTFTATDHAQDAGPQGSFWFDFVSDTGDGGNATFTVARALLAHQLHAQPPEPAGDVARTCATPPDNAYPRGQLLFLGGDLCYPSAGAQEYQYRFLEMFEGARSTTEADPIRRSAYAVAQNHDWLDSISTFKRYFVNRNNGEVFGMNTPQTRSYFATRLPHGWWVLGLDFALEQDIDRGQYEAFRRLAGEQIEGEASPSLQIQATDQVILIYPEPYWTRPLGDSASPGYPKRYQRLEAMLEAKGIHIRVRLAGDVHHYSRESSEAADAASNDVLLICGSGGAFLHPTHDRSLTQAKVKVLASQPDAMSEELRTATRIGTVTDTRPYASGYTCASTYPARSVSRQLCRGNLLALFKFAWNSCNPRQGDWLQGVLKGNIAFALVLGVHYWAAIYSNSMVFSKAFMADGFVDARVVYSLSWLQMQGMWWRALMFSPLALGIHLVLLVLCLALAKDETKRSVKYGASLVHFLLHVLAASSIFWLTSTLRCSTDAAHCLLPGALLPLLQGALQLLAGTVCGGLIMGLYFWAMSRAGLMWNNAFSPLACEDYKGFLRFRIDAQGHLTGYFFACDRVPKRWQRAAIVGSMARGEARPAWEEADHTPQAQWRLADSFTLQAAK